MEIKKVNFDRKNLTSTYIELRQDLKPILNQSRNAKIADWKSPWFYGAIGFSSIAIAALMNNEYYLNMETNEKTNTLSKREIIVDIKSLDLSIKKV